MIAGDRLAAGRPGSWADGAPCRGKGDLFFPPTGTPSGSIPAIHRQAKAICRRCEVLEPCLEFAMATGQPDGIWGGLDADERRGLRYELGQADIRRRGSGAVRG